MKYDKIDSDELRAAIIKTLKVMKRYKPRSARARRLINELIEIPIEISLISRIMEVNEAEGITRTEKEIVTHLYISNLMLGMEAVESGNLDDFLEDVRVRFNESAALSV